MKQIISERFYTYWADSQHSWTVRFITTLCDEMRQLGLNATISWRRPLLVATVADYHE